jgi:hypothetical protein
MADARCLHLKRTRGILQSDLSRTADKASIYSVQLIAHICESCGNVEFYCDSHHEVCTWLTSSPAGARTDNCAPSPKRS